MYQLVLLRHGQSQWNLENKFTGWTDVPLTDRGEQEAHQAGQRLKAENYQFDLVLTNLLKRCIKTAWITMEEIDQMWLPVEKHWQLNERFYGDLTGKNKAEVAQQVGEEQVLQWRRGYATPPPAITRDDPRWPGHDRRYAHLPPEVLPLTESLADVVKRLVPLWQSEIAPRIKAGQRILIVASGNSLRALVKYLDQVSEPEITQLNIPTGIPLVYHLDDDLMPEKHFYLADQAELDQRVNEVKNQIKG